MTVSVTCECGATYRLKPEYVGKAIKCPKCHLLLNTKPTTNSQESADVRLASSATVANAAGGIADLLDDANVKSYSKAAGTACPSCSSQLEVGAVLCVHCGFHLEKRKKLKAKVYKKTKALKKFS
ncbi:MAG: hypothetical protein MPJ24_09830 [Pirellulaceae bacterium]|nr:hypothetical protein [Pirellulaceae bacterium]